MKTIFKRSLIALLIIVAVGGMIYQGSFAPRADAATSNPGPTLPNYQIVVLPISAITTTTTGIVKFTAPWPITLACAYAVSNDVTGSVTFDVVNSSGTTLLASAITASTTTAQGTLTATTANLSITDETTVAINTAGTGTANNSTVTLCIRRR